MGWGMTQPAMSGRWAVSRRVRAHVISEIASLSLGLFVTDLSCILAPADQMMQYVDCICLQFANAFQWSISVFTGHN